MKSTTFFTALLSLSSIAAARPWPQHLEHLYEVGGAEEVALQRRQQNSGSSAPTTPTQTTTGSNAFSFASGATRASAANSNSGSTITSAPTGGSGSSNSSSATSTTDSIEYDPRLPAGGVSMITPNPFSGTQYYKIGDYVTFAWNYTSLSATPTAINVLASCKANANIYTLASNMSIGDTNTLLWDTNAYMSTAAVPLLTNQYTLIIEDSQGSITDTPKAGYLAAQQALQFGMYTPQPYTPFSDFNCALCNGATTLIERNALMSIVGVVAVAAASFTWFASSFGVL